MEFRFKLKEFGTTLVIKFDEAHDMTEVNDVIEDAYYEYMHAEETDMDEEMFTEIDNMTVGGWIIYRLDDAGYYTAYYYEE